MRQVPNFQGESTLGKSALLFSHVAMDDALFEGEEDFSGVRNCNLWVAHFVQFFVIGN